MPTAAVYKAVDLKGVALNSLSKTNMIKQLQQNAAKVQAVKSLQVNGQFSIKLDASSSSTGFFSNAFYKINGSINNTSGVFQTSFQAPGNMYTKVSVKYQTKEPVSLENYYAGDKQYIKLPLVPGNYSWVERQAPKNTTVEAVRNIPMVIQPSLLKNLSLVYKGNGEFTYNGSISSAAADQYLPSVGVPKEIRDLFQTISGSLSINGKLTVDPKTYLTKAAICTISLLPKDPKVFKKLSVTQNLFVTGYNSTTVAVPKDAINAISMPTLPLPLPF